jgi:hypothetical protein
MNEPPAELVTCRLCEAPVARDATVCPSCGAKEPWIPDAPRLSLRVVRLIMWAVGIVASGLVPFVLGMLVFGPVAQDDERDHRPPRIGTVGR